MDKSQYKNVYVFVEQRDGVVQNVALELLGKARELADALHEQVIALLLGKGVKDKADELIAAGADVVLRSKPTNSPSTPPSLTHRPSPR